MRIQLMPRVTISVLLLIACGGTPTPHDAAPVCDRDHIDAMLALEQVIDGQAQGCGLDWYVEGLVARAPNAGPWHEDLFMVRTLDGFHFDLSGARRIATKAAVPQVARDAQGRIHLIYVEGDLSKGEAMARAGDPWMRDHGLVGFGSLNQLISDDEGQSWRAEPEFRVAGLVRGMVVDPELHALPEGGWRLYVIGTPVPALLEPGAWDDGADHLVFSSTSTDLVHWTQDKGVVVEGPNADPAVWCEGDRCLMVSTGLDWSESTDGGKTFTFKGDFGVPGFAPAFLGLPDGRVRLLYNSKDKGGPLRSMVSVDGGRSWEREPGDRVPAFQLEAPAFLPHPEGGWWAFYHYWQEGYSGDSWEKGYAARPEGSVEEAPAPTEAQGPPQEELAPGLKPRRLPQQGQSQ